MQPFWRRFPTGSLLCRHTHSLQPGFCCQGLHIFLSRISPKYMVSCFWRELWTQRERPTKQINGLENMLRVLFTPRHLLTPDDSAIRWDTSLLSPSALLVSVMTGVQALTCFLTSLFAVFDFFFHHQSWCKVWLGHWATAGSPPLILTSR